MPENLAAVLLTVLWLVLILLMAFRFLRQRLAPEKSVWAQVVDKHKIEFFSRTGPRARYTVVFQTDSGKKLSFYVSEFSFGGYRRGETGTLKYRGDRIIDFH